MGCGDFGFLGRRRDGDVGFALYGATVVWEK
jgi:hypothetical protein